MSDEKVVPLTTPGLAPDPHVVAFCEDLLERAKSGRLRGIVAAMAVQGRCTSSGFELGDGTIADLVCSIERVKLRLLAGIGNEP